MLEFQRRQDHRAPRRFGVVRSHSLTSNLLAPVRWEPGLIVPMNEAVRID
jgi:hypothetical protein